MYIQLGPLVIRNSSSSVWVPPSCSLSLAAINSASRTRRCQLSGRGGVEVQLGRLRGEEQTGYVEIAHYASPYQASFLGELGTLYSAKGALVDVDGTDGSGHGATPIPRRCASRGATPFSASHNA